MDYSRLFEAAWQGRARAYAPYSGFQVGAALETADGQVFVGCNVENLSFGLTVCAERGAVMAAVAAGARDFTVIAIVSDSREPISPCGACRQVLAEFAPGIEVRSANLQGQLFVATLEELLPRARAGILDRRECST